MKTEKNICPVCKSVCDSIISYTVKQSATHICPVTRNADRNQRLVNVLTELWPDGHCNIYRCSNCGFGFGVPFIGGNEKYYQILHEQMGYPAWRWDYDVALSEINKLTSGKVLDIGAGVGRFLLTLNSNWKKFALESSSATISILEKEGIETYQYLEDLQKKYKEQFSCVTLFQVLEHISTFNEIIKQSYCLLQQGGAIIITVPSADAMFLQEKILGHADMPPHHINKWTKKSLSIVLENNGFEVKSYVEEKKSFKNIRSKVHMKILANSGIKGSLTSQLYKIQNKRIRILFIALIAPFIFLSLIGHFKYLLKGGAFGIVAIKKINS